jgi:hypothetical protein
MELPLELGVQSWPGEVVGLFLHSDLLPGEQVQQECSVHETEDEKC